MKNIIIINLFFLIELIKSQSEKYEEEKCKSIQPIEDMIEDCTEYKMMSNNKKCCYLEIIYEEGDMFLCYPVEKKIDVIKEEIEILTDIYEDSESININCCTSFIDISFFFISCLFLFFVI